MEKEYDLDDLIEENQVKVETKKKKKKKQNKWVAFGLKSVLPATVTLICGVVLGSMASAPSEDKDKQITAILSSGTLQESVNSVVEAQNRALMDQLAELTGKNTGSDYGQNTQYGGALAKTNADLLEPFFAALLADNPNRTDKEREEALKQYFNISVQTTSQDSETQEASLDDTSKQVLSNLRAFVAGPSLSKLYQTETAKAGNVSSSMMNFSTNGAVFYQVMIPVATAKDNMVRQAMYVVKVVNSKIVSASFIGTITNNSNILAYYESLLGQVANATINSETENYNRVNDGSATDPLPQNNETSPSPDENVSGTTEESSATAEEPSEETSPSSSSEETE